MKLFASVRFAHALAARERESAARTIRSAGATATSWNDAAARTYAMLAFEASDTPQALATSLDGDVHAPPLVVLRVIPDAPRRLAALSAALGGAGRPGGVVATARECNAIVVELDARITPLATVVALVDAETGAHARRIEPVLPLEDATLATFAGSVLGEPALAAGRILESYLEPRTAAEP